MSDNGAVVACHMERYLRRRREFWDSVARASRRKSVQNRIYHRRLEQICRFLIPEGVRVLELGCGIGDLLASVKPSYGVGVDASPEMVRRAATHYPSLKFVVGVAEEFAPKETFDIIILSDLVNELWDVQACLERCRAMSHPDTRIILNFYSRLWQVPLGMARKCGLATPLLEQNWLAASDVINLLQLAGFSPVRTSGEVLFPLPLISSFADRVLARIWPFTWAVLTNFVVARPQPARQDLQERPSVTVVVPARNEAGNIRQIVQRLPAMGGWMEILFVEGHSSDNTYAAIEEVIREFPDRKMRLFRQSGKGKGDAVRKGFAEARGDILMILDADMTVPPESLPRFYHALISGDCDFVNGVRLVYPMEEKAMRFFNLVGNKFFSLAFSWVLDQEIKDTLCGTKVLWKRDYERIAANRSYFGDFDPFGDFDLIFGAAKLNMKIVDMPVRYGERTYGDTNIQRWRHGWLLLKMLCFAARRLKFQ